MYQAHARRSRFNADRCGGKVYPSPMLRMTPRETNGICPGRLAIEYRRLADLDTRTEVKFHRGDRSLLSSLVNGAGGPHLAFTNTIVQTELR